MNYLAESLRLPEVSGSLRCPDISFVYKEDYFWAEQVYRAGDMVALVALYKNIPQYLQNDLDQIG